VAERLTATQQLQHLIVFDGGEFFIKGANGEKISGDLKRHHLVNAASKALSRPWSHHGRRQDRLTGPLGMHRS
jgi:hypothetical protein